MRPPVLIPIVKIVGFSCNLRCSYCFYQNIDQSEENLNVMSDNLLEKLIYDVFQLNQEFYTFLWHGGEPLLAGLGFFQKIIDYQKRFNVGQKFIDNRIQTNGILLDAEWINFLKKNNFSVGISIDGPELVHDRYRSDICGRGSFQEVYKKIKLAQKLNLNFGVIAVVSSWSAKFPKEVMEFFLQNNIKRITLNPAFEIDERENVMDFSVSDKDYRRFLEKIIGQWAELDDPEIQIRQIQEPLKGLLHGKNSVCNYCGTCSHSVDVHLNGDVTPCHETIRGNPVLLGNLYRLSMGEILDGSDWSKYDALTRTITESCLRCQWFNFCHGGCVHHRILTVRGSAEKKNIYCGTRKRVFKILSEMVAQFEKD